MSTTARPTCGRHHRCATAAARGTTVRGTERGTAVRCVAPAVRCPAPALPSVRCARSPYAALRPPYAAPALRTLRCARRTLRCVRCAAPAVRCAAHAVRCAAHAVRCARCAAPGQRMLHRRTLPSAAPAVRATLHPQHATPTAQHRAFTPRRSDTATPPDSPHAERAELSAAVLLSAELSCSLVSQWQRICCCENGQQQAMQAMPTS